MLTFMEVWGFIQVPLVWYLFRRFGKRNVTGELIAGTIIGAFIEFATEPLWDYHLKVTVYKDVPLVIVIGWGMMFTLATCLSEWMYKKVTGKTVVDDRDKRLLLLDVVCAVAVALPIEKLGLATGVWTYRYDLLQWDWGKVPFFNMPLEALFGYALLMLIGPSYVRHWQREFE